MPSMELPSPTAARSFEPAETRRVDRRFFDAPTAGVARALLGRLFGTRSPDGVRVVRLVETEAYVADDPANHADRGPTPRNRSMFGPAGTLYVYRIHQVVCANIVTRPGQAVLLRAGEPRTPGLSDPRGPGRLCRALGISREDDGTDLVRSDRFFVGGLPEPVGPVSVGPRVGLRRAAERPLRFALTGNPWVSRPVPWAARRVSAVSPSGSPGVGGRRRSRTRRRPASGGGRRGGRSAGK